MNKRNKKEQKTYVKERKAFSSFLKKTEGPATITMLRTSDIKSKDDL